MANRQLTVLNPGGYQELLQSADTLVVEGAVNMDSNNIGGLPAPSSDNDAARKKYIDDAIAGVSVDLQGVTTAGNTTTNSITTAGATFNGNISANSLRLPEISGTYPLGYLEFGDPGASSNNGMRMGFSNTTSNGIIEHLDTAGDLYISSGKDVIIDNIGSSEPRAKFLNNGACELYHDGTKRLATTNVAVDVTGILTVSENINIGATSATSFSSTTDGGGGYNTIIDNNSTGDLYLRGTELYIQDNANSNQEWIHCLPGAGVELSYGGVKKIETKSTGVDVTGSLGVSVGLDVDGEGWFANNDIWLRQLSSGIGQIVVDYATSDQAIVGGNHAFYINDMSSTPSHSNLTIDWDGNYVSTGDITAVDATMTGDVTAVAFIGNGSQLTNLPASATPTLQQVTTQGTTTTTGASFGGDVSTTANLSSVNVTASGTVSAAVFDIDALTALP